MSIMPVVGKPGHFKDNSTGREIFLQDVVGVEVHSKAGDQFQEPHDDMIMQVRDRLTLAGWTPEKIESNGARLLDDGCWAYMFVAYRPATYWRGV